ncbi:hypothetical protein BDCR2A_01793 [Borrelia duttonii CR2A]|uniref:Uncharacterized protein n=1 Tax=Borrelia duttonii CR2A TaxID=1432657 RepID=W6TW15_9SPIR|nr:hypothetical protein BDCR2A_01793 [Borrelia duttonii CR2A]
MILELCFIISPIHQPYLTLFNIQKIIIDQLFIFAKKINSKNYKKLQKKFKPII